MSIDKLLDKLLDKTTLVAIAMDVSKPFEIFNGHLLLDCRFENV